MRINSHELFLQTLLGAAGLGSLLILPGCVPNKLQNTGGETPAMTTGDTGTVLTSGGDSLADFDPCEPYYYEGTRCFEPPGGVPGDTGSTGPGGSTSTASETTMASTSDDTGSTGPGGFTSTASETTTASTSGDTSSTEPGGSTTSTAGETTAGETTSTSTDATSLVPADETDNTEGFGEPCDWANPSSIYTECGTYVHEIGPAYLSDGYCCVNVTFAESCCGRPFIVADEVRRAPRILRADWCAGAMHPESDEVDVDTRRAIADEWAADGLAEHASIAAFARFILQLLALGAPPEFVVAAQAAIADEVEHARLCFALASAFSSTLVGPGPLAIAAALDHAADLETATLAAFHEGCVGETLAALETQAARESASDPAVVAALARIAEDELRHAALAWKFLAWALDRGGPSLHAAFATTIAGLAVADTNASPPAADDEEPRATAMRAHGRLSRAERLVERHASLRTIVLPLSRALLHRHVVRTAA